MVMGIILHYYVLQPGRGHNLRGGGHIDLGADPVGVGVILSCLHNIL